MTALTIRASHLEREGAKASKGARVGVGVGEGVPHGEQRDPEGQVSVEPVLEARPVGKLDALRFLR